MKNTIKVQRYIREGDKGKLVTEYTMKIPNFKKSRRYRRRRNQRSNAFGIYNPVVWFQAIIVLVIFLGLLVLLLITLGEIILLAGGIVGLVLGLLKIMHMATKERREKRVREAEKY